MKIRLIFGNFDEKSGVSIVKISTKFGQFEGIANLNPKDPYPSRIFGCEIAEARATIKALNVAIKYKYSELKGAKRVRNMMTDSTDKEKADNLVKAIEREYNSLRADKRRIQKFISHGIEKREEIVQSKKKLEAFAVLNSKPQDIIK